MANRVTISTFSAAPPSVAPDTALEDVTTQMIEFWRAKTAKVLPDRPDLIVLPEMCDRPAGWPCEERRKYFEARGNRVRDFFAGMAGENACYIAYSSARQAGDGTWRNSTALLDRTGGVTGIYNKNHLTIQENEEGGLLYGKDAPLIECDFGRVACAICFDLNFDELRLKYAAARPDLILFSSMYHGGLMQPYWAYSCRAHFAAAVPGKPSAVLAPTGEVIATTTNYFDYVTATINLDCALCHLDGNWPKLDAAKAKYGRKVAVHDPGFLGSVLLSSETDEFTVEDIVKEFELEPLDDYFQRALAHRHENGHMEK